jgi:phosphonopyruvate decarboxylase
MIQAASFAEEAKKAGFRLWTGVPCSYLKPFINYVIDAPDLTYVGAANEGDAVAISSGAELGGMRSIVMFQNSGFGNTVNPLTSLNAIFKIPVLVITTWRGEPGGPADEPQHELMGQITEDLFKVMRIPYEFFPENEDEIGSVLERAISHMDRTRTPYGLIMKKDAVGPHKLTSKPVSKKLSASPLPTPRWKTPLPSRREILTAVQAATDTTTAVFATTGFMGRSLYALEDRPNQLYMVGSMGCVSTFALGFRYARPNTPIVVLDGDGAVLMRMGALATIGYERPASFVHMILDNEAHDSTGAQSTVTHSIDLGQIAHACGYQRVVQTNDSTEIANLLASKPQELTLIHAKVGLGEPSDLPRPKVTPVEVGNRIRAHFEKISK